MALLSLCFACLVSLVASFEDSALVQAYVGFMQEPTVKADRERELVSAANMLFHVATHPRGDAGLDDKGEAPLPPNVTTEELLKAAKSVLDAFRSQHFVNTAYEGLQNMTWIWSVFAGYTATRVQSLNATAHNLNVSQDVVFKKLYRFWLEHGQDASQVLAAAAASFEVLGTALPIGYLRELLPGKLGGPDAVYHSTLANLSVLVDDRIDTAFNVSYNETHFCERMGIFLTNVTTAYLELPKIIKALNKALPRMPSMEPAVMDVAPDVGPTLFEFMNKSYSMASNVSRLLESVLMNVTNVSTSILVDRLGCDAASLEAEMLESGCSHHGLSLASFVAMVWLVLRDW